MKSLSSLLLGLALLLTSASLAQTQAPTDSTALKVNWKKMKEKGYSMGYPPHWVMNVGSVNGVAFTLYAPEDKSLGGYEANINLSVQDLSDKKLDLNSYTRLSERQIHTLVENSKLIKSVRNDTADVPYHQITYTGDFNETKLKWMMRFWVVKDKVYILTYTALKDNFELQIEAAKEIMNTFKLR